MNLVSFTPLECPKYSLQKGVHCRMLRTTIPPKALRFGVPSNRGVTLFGAVIDA